MFMGTTIYHFNDQSKNIDERKYLEIPQDAKGNRQVVSKYG